MSSLYFVNKYTFIAMFDDYLIYNNNLDQIIESKKLKTIYSHSILQYLFKMSDTKRYLNINVIKLNKIIDDKYFTDCPSYIYQHYCSYIIE